MSDDLTPSQEADRLIAEDYNLSAAQKAEVQTRVAFLNQRYGIKKYDAPGISQVTYGIGPIEYEPTTKLLNTFSAYIDLIVSGEVGSKVFVCLPALDFVYDTHIDQYANEQTMRIYSASPNQVIYLSNRDRDEANRFRNSFLEAGIYGFIANSINEISSITPADIDERGFVKAKDVGEGES